MMDDASLNAWFCREVLPLEPALTRFIRRNWRQDSEVTDLRQEIYERALLGARNGLPQQSRAFVYTVARNHLINRAKHGQIVSFDLVADLEEGVGEIDLFATERQLTARDELRQAMAGLESLPSRCREVIQLRKIEGLSRSQTAERLGVSIHTIEKQLTLGMRALVDHMLGGTGKIVRPSFIRRHQRRKEP